MLSLQRRAFLLSAAGATLTALGSATVTVLGRPARAAAPSPMTIEIEDFAFSPSEVTVPPGTKVTWMNRDDEPHTVVGLNMKFRSQALDTDDGFSFVFTKPGTYRYLCSIHPHMKGTITVRAG